MKEQSNSLLPTSIVQIQTYTMDVVIKGKGQKRGEHQHGKKQYTQSIIMVT